jgi:glycosyltransferase involved in cell wall biosynthesis
LSGADLAQLEMVVDHDRSALFELYRRAKVVCLTSRWESFGLVLLEAMYAGCHVVTTNVGAAADITDNGGFGTLVDEPTPEQLAARLGAVLRARAGDPSADQAAHDRVVTHFDWKPICRRLAEIVEGTATETGRRSMRTARWSMP